MVSTKHARSKYKYTLVQMVFMGRGFTFRGQESGCAFGAVVCKNTGKEGLHEVLNISVERLKKLIL